MPPLLSSRGCPQVPRSPDTAAPVVAVILKGYPRLSETFIANEILALERSGLDLRLFSLRHPTDAAVHPVHRRIQAPVVYLPEYLHHAPLRVWQAWRTVRRWPHYEHARAAWLRDLRRDPSRNRVRRFGQAIVLAHELPADVTWLHAHFLHTPASVTRYAAMLSGLPWSVSAHAKDVWTTPEWDIREKLAACEWLVTCTACNAAYLRTLSTPQRPVELLYHGIDLHAFAALPSPSECVGRRDGSDPSDPVRLLSIGRAVEKKGYDVLLQALAALPPSTRWRLVHIGGGPLLKNLKAMAQVLGLAERIEWRGPRSHDDVLQAYREADIFVLACRIAADGDRDGLPNVLMEAQSQRLPCVSTTVSAVPELIVSGETGLLVPPGDPLALAEAIGRLIAAPDERERLGLAGLARVRTDFSFGGAIERLKARFRPAVAPRSEPCVPPSTLP
ncbi:Glycosyl transferase [Candidatus Defluviicoccus seviourii]|uniref:Glycosyl transferase n=1 Tax=Candidatus Defluviicoccus seviourii TaxID=2565273 RepID=A0A564WG87_9PROT|nr:Glycosyl transferase [Candidatus Defluviicoccus seviourii]